MADIDSCSFCGTPSNELPKGALLKSQRGAFLCENCIEDGGEAIARRRSKDPSKAERTLRKPAEIKQYLDQHIIAQERVKKDVAVAVYNHFKRRDAHRLKKAGQVEIEKSNILLLGPTGTGKTHTFRALSKMLDVPFYIQDCTRITQAGYVGEDADDILRGLMEAASGDVAKAEWGIVLLDEFDKLARKSGRGASGYRDVSGEGVQQSLLKILEGSKQAVSRGRGKGGSMNFVGPDGQVRSNTDIVDTTNVLFVCAGSFAGIEEVVHRRVNKNTRLGFGTDEHRRKDMSMTAVYENVTQDDILDFGIIPEMLGRLPVLTSTYELSDDDMVRVLTEPQHSIIRQFQALFAMDDIGLEFDREALLEIGRAAKRLPMGARALRTIVEKILRPYSFSAPSDDRLRSIRITADTVTKGSDAILQHGVREPEPERMFG
jgi:ATP-dependent Clp protease ATP-binding subunit ClpX